MGPSAAASAGCVEARGRTPRMTRLAWGAHITTHTRFRRTILMTRSGCGRAARHTPSIDKFLNSFPYICMYQPTARPTAPLGPTLDSRRRGARDAWALSFKKGGEDAANEEKGGGSKAEEQRKLSPASRYIHAGSIDALGPSHGGPPTSSSPPFTRWRDDKRQAPRRGRAGRLPDVAPERAGRGHGGRGALCADGD